MPVTDALVVGGRAASMQVAQSQEPRRPQDAQGAGPNMAACSTTLIGAQASEPVCQVVLTS